MSVSITDIQGLVLFLASLIIAVLVLLLVTLALVFRPWELRGLSWHARTRVVGAVIAYDAWLDVHGVSVRRRRALRAELRANLWEAAQLVGYRQARAAIGSLRTLARAAVREPSGPTWDRGAALGLLAGATVVILQVAASAIWLQAAKASGAGHVDGTLGVFPGMRIAWAAQPGTDGFVMSIDMGPSAFVIGLLTFVLTARPWRSRSRKAQGHAETRANSGSSDLSSDG